jgi:uncharacterized membrane protein YeiB
MNVSEENHQSLSPVTESARIDVMDILRGFALIGIVFMNIEWFNRSGTDLRTFDVSLTGMNHAVGWLVRAFVEGKFYKLFALLFGMGFAVMLLRAREAGRPFGAWFIRRMLVLMLIGFLHQTAIFCMTMRSPGSFFWAGFTCLTSAGFAVSTHHLHFSKSVLSGYCCLSQW